MSIWKTVIVLMMLVQANELRAELTVREYQARITSTDEQVAAVTRAYIAGLGQGISWTRTATMPRLYCEPEHLSMRVENYIDVLDNAIKMFRLRVTPDKLQETPIAFLLLQGLQLTFPCQKDK